MRNRRNKRKTLNLNKKVIAISSSAVIAIISLLVFSVIFSIINSNTGKIVPGIKIEGIDVSNLTQNEAKEKVTNWYKETAKKNINLYYEDLEEMVNINEFEAENNIDKKVEEAMKVGRSGNILKDNYNILFTMLFRKNINIDITYNEEKIDRKVKEISNKLPGAVVENSYYIEDEKLIILKGKEGVIAKKDELKEKIKETVRKENKDITIPVENVGIEDIDIEKIHEEIYKEPQDAYVTENPKTIFAGVNGVDFAISMEEAKEILSGDMEEYIIPLRITIPEKTLANMEVFPDKLAEYTTRYDVTNPNRSNNLTLASNKIDGTIVLPGEIFSYNKIVGERTIAKGYKEAAIYSGGKVVQGIGGGICQLSSTLYNTVLYANLEVTSRSNHRFLTSYVPEGRDATVSWGTIDFCFKNTRKYPIKVVSNVKNGIVKVSIYGIKEETEYEVELKTNILETTEQKINYINDNALEEGTEVIKQYGSEAVKSETYKILKLNGAVVSKELISTDTYSSLERIIRRGTKKVKTTQVNAGDTTETNNNGETEGFTIPSVENND